MTKSNLKSRFTAWILIAAMLISLLCLNIPTAQAAEYTAEGATSFVFSDSGISATEGNYSGYKIEGAALTINEAGTYIVSGSCSDGSIKIRKGTTGVTLVLNGLTLTSSDTAPISCNKSSQATIVVASGSTNTLTDSEKNNDETYTDNTNAENAVIKCKDGSQVVICGSGTLNIEANAKNGIKSGATTEEEGEASLTIQNVTLNINASVNDAINAEQLLNIESGNLTINAADDAIHCDLVMNIGASGTAGPTIKIESSVEGIEASTLKICSGNITINSSDDCMNAANSDLTDYSFSIDISGGTIYGYSTGGDGFDSNGSLTISGGSVTIWTANSADNQPLDADGQITISGGTVLAAGASNGMGMNLSATQPYVTFGSTGGMGGGMGGGMTPPDMNGNTNGGTTPPDMSGNTNGGMTPPDMNGNANGGMTPPDMSGNTNGGTTPPDMSNNTNGSAPSGMGGSASASIAKGSTIAIKDASGNTVYSATAPCNANFVLFSSDDLTTDSSYTLYADSTSAGTATAQTGTAASQQPGGGMMPNGSGDGTTPPAKPDGTTGGTTGGGSTGTSGGTSSGTTGGTTGGTSSGSTGTSGTTGSSSENGAAASQGFTDVKTSDWFYNAVNYVKEKGLMNGSSDTEFSPNQSTTRGMIVTILYRLAGSPEVTAENDFSDVKSGTYYEDAIAWANANKIALGYSNGNFGPNDTITREQLATILYRYADFMGYDVSNTNDLSGFSDSSKISSYAKDAFAWVNAANMITGTSNTTLSPTGDATRAQLATILMRFCENIAQK